MKKLNSVQIALRYSEPEMEVVRLGIVFPEFKACLEVERESANSQIHVLTILLYSVQAV